MGRILGEQAGAWMVTCLSSVAWTSAALPMALHLTQLSAALLALHQPPLLPRLPHRHRHRRQLRLDTTMRHLHARMTRLQASSRAEASCAPRSATTMEVAFRTSQRMCRTHSRSASCRTSPVVNTVLSHADSLVVTALQQPLAPPLLRVFASTLIRQRQ